MLNLRQPKWWMVGVVVMMATLAGCGPTEEASSLSSLWQATSGSPLSWYKGSDAVTYAGKNYNQDDGPKPFDAFSENCVNFVSQCILSGLTGGNTNPYVIYGYRFDYDGDATSTKTIKWFYHTTTGGDTGSGKAWRSTTNLLNYAKQSSSETYGLRFAYITNSYRTSPENFYVETVQPGDVAFVQWYADGGTYHHTMIVISVDPDTSKGSLDRIHIAAQNTDTPNSTLRQMYNWGKSYYAKIGGIPVFQIYRPWYYYAGP